MTVSLYGAWSLDGGCIVAWIWARAQAVCVGTLVAWCGVLYGHTVVFTSQHQALSSQLSALSSQLSARGGTSDLKLHILCVAPETRVLGPPLLVHRGWGVDSERRVTTLSADRYIITYRLSAER